ncbi:CFEM domain-containing protein [Mycena chlorophos]|uniref:CFEM domain-containing protein n=1 Tax=Mycena chlorophos TaxID=658473 RepID=A0A8H6VZW0_MYCCL|nr:CFEM domain-containing protein [Mycena chlorophos]
MQTTFTLVSLSLYVASASAAFAPPFLQAGFAPVQVPQLDADPVVTSAAASAAATDSASTNSSLPFMPSGSPSSMPASQASSAAAAIASLTPCAIDCLQAAAALTPCGTFTNATCACTDPNFQMMSATCIQGECDADEATAAMELQQSQCAAASLYASGQPTATSAFLPSNSAADFTPSASVSGSVTVTGGAAASASQSASSARALRMHLGGMGASVVVAIAGVVLQAMV